MEIRYVGAEPSNAIVAGKTVLDQLVSIADVREAECNGI